jgi:hypothetical protein
MLPVPLFHLGPYMNELLVKNQKDVTDNLTKETPQKICKPPTLKSPFENYKGQSFLTFLDPISHWMAILTENLGRLNPGCPFQEGPQDFLTKIFLGDGERCSCISQFHTLRILFLMHK